jgi:hypothetical protein
MPQYEPTAKPLTLATLRDTLLPELLSGELSIVEAGQDF